MSEIIKPNKLYQYRSIDNTRQFMWLLELLETGRIFCNSIKNLNDPFDSRSILPLKKPSDILNGRDVLDKKWLSMINKMPDIILDEDRMPRSELIDDKPLESGLKLERITIPTLTDFEYKNLYNDFIKTSFKYLYDDIIALSEDWNEKGYTHKEHYTDMQSIYLNTFNHHTNEILEKITLASFSENWDNMTMWSHYANGYKGVCLEFDVDSVDSNNLERYLYPVQYVDVLQNVPRFIINRFECDKEINSLDVILSCATQKLKSWNYEEEWRYISLDSDRYPKSSLPFTRPSKIILGNSIDEDIRARLIQIGDDLKILVTRAEISQFGIKERPENNLAVKELNGLYMKSTKLKNK